MHKNPLDPSLPAPSPAPAQTDRWRSLAPVALAVVCLAASQSTWAQTSTIESAPAFLAFEKWVGAALVTVPDTAPTKVETFAPATKGGATMARYEPRPVILGAPELPLLGRGAAQAAAVWGDALNYQGMYARLLLLDPKTQKHSAAPLSTKIKASQRFKIRITSTFDGVAAVDQVLGTAWDAQRSGQVYPPANLSVEVKAGQTVDLPLGPSQYMVLDGRPANERLVLSLRHARALGAAASEQPAYRQGDKTGSSYLQLVPKGKYPIIEQVLTSGR